MTKQQQPEVVRAFAPATVANVGPGFDCLGFALAGLGDAVEVLLRPDAPKRRPVTIEVRGDDGQLPTKPAKNCASAVALAMLQDAQADFGVDILLGKGLPLGSGLGSSAASSAAAAVAMNKLLGDRYQAEELVQFAAQGERVACGVAHLDNVTPAILGGLVLVRHSRTVQAITVDTPKWWVGLCYPQIEFPTRQARAALPRHVELHDVTRNVSNAASMMVALLSDDLELFGRCLMSDVIVEKRRAKFIPNYDLVRQAALTAGAAGVTICGAGPSVFAISDNESDARSAASAMSAVWRSLDYQTTVMSSPLGGPGAGLAQ